jgi:toxin-antitoxin system PIN domain toxin
MLAFDTNLLFYASNQDSPFHQGARSFLDNLRENPRVLISELVLVELYRLLRNPTINETPLGPKAATQVIETYRRHPVWRLVGFSPEGRAAHDRLWQAAGKPAFAYRRIYDARLAISLLDQGVDEFATANVKDFEGLGFRRVWNPLASG